MAKRTAGARLGGRTASESGILILGEVCRTRDDQVEEALTAAGSALEQYSMLARGLHRARGDCRLFPTISIVFVLVLLPTPVAFTTPAEVMRSLVVADDAAVEKVSSGHKFTEGPAVDPAGNVYFTDQPNNRILRWSTDGSVSVFMENAGRANGLFFDIDGRLLACADKDNELWSIDTETREKSVVVSDYRGKRLNGPNDLWVDPKGGIYFTDPFYRREYWSHSEPKLEDRNVYYVSPNRQTVTVVASDFVQPNGIIGSADGNTLYVADIGDNKTYRFAIGQDGSLTDRTVFVEMGSDGMTLDDEGNLYLTGQGVTVFDSEGKQIEHIDIHEGWTANVTFGGPDRQTLFITAMGSLYALQMKVKGAR